MLVEGQQSNNKASRWKWLNVAERRIFVTGAAVSLLAIIIALIFGLLNNAPNSIWPVVAQFAVSLIVLGFTVWDYMLGLEGRPNENEWKRGAIICAIIVSLTALLTGPYYNIMLTPLLVGLAQRRNDQMKVITLGLSGVGLVAIELLIFYGFQVQRFNVDGAGTSLIAIAALTLALASLMRHYQSEVLHFKEEAANKASEMEVAHEIQTSLMPPNNFTSGNWTLSARSLPALDVGGDFFEYVKHPHLDNTISGIAIGDVAGKGIPAALQMAVVRTLFRVEARRRIFPGETLMSVNMALQAERSFGMVTMLYAFIDITSNTIHLANAGHNYPLVLGETLEEIALPGVPLGIDDGIEYDEKIIQLTPGTSLIFYTDGVPEAMDCNGDLYTFERFKDAVAANKGLEPEEMVEQLLKEIADFTEGAPQSDDITLLVLSYHPQPADLDLPKIDNLPEPVMVEAGGNRLTELMVDEDGVNWI